MKSPKVKGIGEIVTDYGAKVMKVIKKGLLGRSLFDFYGDVKTNALRVKESPSVPQTPIDQDGGVVYVKTADGKLYYKSNEVAEVELSAHTGLSTEEVQDIAGALVATGGTKTGIAVTYQDATGDVDFVVDHDAATNYVAAEHVDWAASGAGTIHTDNYIENVVQTTVSGSSGTVTSIGNLTGDVTSSNRATTIADGVVDTDQLADDAVTEGKLANALLAEIDANTAKATNVSTNLTYTTGSDRITIVSSDGTNVVIAEASGSIAGVMTVAHHDKLDSIEDSATADQTKSDIDGLGITTVGALSSGTIASGFGNIDNGTSTLDTGLATVGDLHVSVAGQATLDLIDTGGQTYQIFARNSDDVFGLYDGTNTQTFFRYTGHATPASTKLALLEAGGKVGIGTASPSQALDVSGNVNISGTIELGNATDTTLDRVSAGVVSIEGAHVKTQSLTIKVFPNQFINNDDTGRPVFLEDDTSNTLAARGHSTGDDFYAFVEIPPLHKVTHVQVHASANTSSAVSVRSFNYQTGADNAIAATTANFNENKAVTNIPATATQDLVIKCTPGANTVLVYGATVTLALYNMALGSKRGGTIHNKTGDEKNRLKAKYDAGDHTALENFPAEAAVLYQMQQMSEDIDELRRYLTAEVGNGADGSNGSDGSDGSDGADGADSGTYDNTLKILPTQFMGNDDASLERTVIEDDIRNKLGVRVASSSQEIFANVSIPKNKKVTNYRVYSSASVATSLFGGTYTTGAITTLASGNSGATIDVRNNYNSTETNYVALKITTTATNQIIYGATLTLADI